MQQFASRLGFSRRTLITGDQRRYEVPPAGLAVPIDLVTCPFCIYEATSSEAQNSELAVRLFGRYPVQSLLEIAGEACRIRRRDGSTRSVTVPELRPEYTCRLPATGDAPSLLQRWCTAAHAGDNTPVPLCADQDYIAAALRRANEALIAAGVDWQQALLLTGRLVLGLLVQGTQPVTVWRDAASVLGRAHAASFTVLPAQQVDSERTSALWDQPDLLTAVAYHFAPLDLRAISCDILGPLMTARLPGRAKRARGVFHTPPALVDLVLDAAGLAHAAQVPGDILDPCAGTGAFIVRLLARARLAGESVPDLSGLFRRVTAVEADPLACALLRINIAVQWVLAGMHIAQAQPPLQVVQGDALSLYSDLPDAEPLPKLPALDTAPPAGDMGPEAQEVKERANYAWVIGNPPYVGESGNRRLFAPYRAHPFWRRFSEPKMDFLQYFIVLGLSKMQEVEGARLCFLTSAYWLTADGASRLRDFILRQALVRDVYYLPDRQFSDAPGHQSVIVLLERCQASAKRNDHRMRQTTLATLSLEQARSAERQGPRQSELIGERWFPTPKLGINLAELAGPELGQYYAVRQGVVPGALRVGQNELDLLGPEWVEKHQIQLGEGVFVLTDAERAALRLPPAEQRWLRPFIKSSCIIPYGMVPAGRLWLIYLRHDQVTAADCPHLLAHLARFRPLLERKREYHTGARNWFHLHWPRNESVFEGDKVLTAHRAASPAFVWHSGSLYAATDTYFIQPRQPQNSPFSLLALTGLLNSSLAHVWLLHRTKRKGEQREFFSRVVERFPLPPLPAVQEAAAWQEAGRLLERQVSEMQELTAASGEELEERRRALAQAIDEVVFDLYRLPAHARREINAWRQQ